MYSEANRLDRTRYCSLDDGYKQFLESLCALCWLFGIDGALPNTKPEAPLVIVHVAAAGALGSGAGRERYTQAQLKPR